MNVADDLADFVRKHVRSVWTLELLLAMRGDPDRTWSVEELVQHLRGSGSIVIGSLQALETSALVAERAPGRFGFAPASPVLDRLCAALADAYRERPVALINLIAAPEDRIQQLADAFRLGGKR